MCKSPGKTYPALKTQHKKSRPSPDSCPDLLLRQEKYSRAAHRLPPTPTTPSHRLPTPPRIQIERIPKTMDREEEEPPGKKKGTQILQENLLPHADPLHYKDISAGSAMTHVHDEFDESIFFKEDFSYMALLNGDIDMNCSSSNINIKVRKNTYKNY
nr:uncharacterized protein LOC127296739 [Lolium perenne]